MNTQPNIREDDILEDELDISATADDSPNGRRRRQLLRGLAAIVLLAGCAFVAWYLLIGRWQENTDDAYVEGNIVQITPQIGGTVVSIEADDGDFVQAGQVLVRFNDADAQIALQQAEATLARTVRQVRGLYSVAGGLKADVSSRQVALEKARADFERRKNLAATGAISNEELAHVRDALSAAESAVTASREQLATSQALVEDIPVATHPEVLAASASLRKASLDAARTVLMAPVSGYVAKRSVQLGQRVQAGTPLMAVVPLDQVWVEANFKETQLQHMHLGQQATLEADFYGGDVEYRGVVQSIGVGTGSAFALLPAQNATGNWIKVVQRVPVRIAVDPQMLKEHPLRVGLSISASVDLHAASAGEPNEAPRRKVALDTQVYSSDLADADAHVEKVLRENLNPALRAARR